MGFRIYFNFKPTKNTYALSTGFISLIYQSKQEGNFFFEKYTNSLIIMNILDVGLDKNIL